MDLLCGLGLSCCGQTIDYTKQIGQLLSWQNLLQIAPIIFAVTQFMESAKLRNYIFRFGFLKNTTAGIIVLSFFTVAAATLIQLTNTHIPLLSYPAFYELIGLISLSVLFVLYSGFLFHPKWFLPKFSSRLLVNMRGELVNNSSDETISAVSSLASEYIDKIVESASLAKRRHFGGDDTEPSKESKQSLHFIDIDISNSSFVHYVAKNNIIFILRFMEAVDKYKLWEAGGNIFADNLSEALFTDPDSLLSKELHFGGYSGIYKPLTNLLFKSSGILSHYRIFQSFRHWTSDISNITLQNWTHGLEEALRYYYSEERNIYSYETPNVAIGYSLERLPEVLRAISYEVNKVPAEEAWESEFGSKMSIITGFFSRLENILVQDDPEAEYKPVFSEGELKAEKHSVSGSIAKALFTFLEAFAPVKHEDYARMLVIQPMWLLFSDHSSPILETIRKKVADLVKERFEENYKGSYASLIKLMLNVYGGGVTQEDRDSNPIIHCVRTEFLRVIADKLIHDAKFKEGNLPSSWFIKGTKIYRTIHDKTELIYDGRGTKTKKPSAKKTK